MRTLTRHNCCPQAVEATKLLALLSGTLAIMAIAAYVVILSFWVSRSNVCSGATPKLHCVRCDCAYICVHDQTNLRVLVLGVGTSNSSLRMSYFYLGRHVVRSLFECTASDLNHRCCVEVLRELTRGKGQGSGPQILNVL